MKIIKPLLALAVGAVGAVGTIALSLPQAAIAQYQYPLGSRAVYMTGCLLDDPPNFNDTNAVIQKNRICLCFLDKFQLEYTNDQFIQLFADIDAGKPEAIAEGERFGRKHFASCI
ncbi:hypothetical protein Pse7367_2531 [Thalassoporum mexicanum PCC 7367]|uniref:hypothetical protein n=1 Tax=Thalassoporum mexicanum TaxID=3457544 RepID=UPI00029FB0BD|nr:hypothetical protein [Pseudanabaena sp. PCC 7367]AFY70791.1 hypothetical protein Pse7367_2531 [Pseudanabaena sp. PCC 7367]